MLLNNQLQNLVNTAHNRMDDSCLRETSISQLRDASRFPRLTGLIRYNGEPQVPSWDPRCLSMWHGIHRAQEAGFRMYIGMIPNLDYMRPVIVLGVGYRIDNFKSIDETQVAWALAAHGGGDFIEIDVNEDGMPIPLTRIDFGFQPSEHNVRVRLNNLLGTSVIDVLADADGELKDVFLEMVESPKPHTADHHYWFDRLELLNNVKAQASAREQAVREKWDNLRTLVAGRLQKDGSKTLFKAKHLTDLPKDFAEQLEAALFIGKE